MPRKATYKQPSFRPRPIFHRWWSDLRFFWHTRSKAPWIVSSMVATVAFSMTFLVQKMESHDQLERDLTCLAMNVYYEARGEPLLGQYAVAEVTMNRVASTRYPDTICEVVYQKKWDPLRKREVSAFSWTEFDIVPHPEGDEWQTAWDVAKAVYQGERIAKVDGATHYHATYIKPSWARGRRHVAKIGRHVFYR
jgi:spore germination cell wall hydrolase CwlJ-like protein